MIKTYEIILQSEPSNSFLSIKAAQSLDIDVKKKLSHHLKIDADFESKFNIGLIVGNSGSGKTSFAKKVFGEKCFEVICDENKPIIEQFPNKYTYDDCANILNSMGLSQVPCWIRPVKTLSNGQRFRAEAALKIAFAEEGEIVAIDEWTSVVDRTVAKIMSHALQKSARRFNKKFILCSCHYDVIDWLQPDFIIDCNKQEYEDRRLLRQERKERLEFSIKEVTRKSWKNFSRYHYLSDKMPGGKIYTFGIFHNAQQIGFQCFANYVIGKQNIYHSNRTVIHPDYCGFGLGLKMVDALSQYMVDKYRYKIMVKFSSVPMLKSHLKSNKWKLKSQSFITPAFSVGSLAATKVKRLRQKVKMYSFEYIPK